MRRADRLPQLLSGALLPLSAGCYSDDILATRVEPAAAACLAQQVQAISSSSHSPCPELAAPTGPIICVGPERADQLAAIVSQAPSGASIVLLDGSYRMSGDEAARSLAFHTPGVTLRSASGRAEQVILDGEYLTGEMIRIAASDVVIAGITLQHALHHAIHITPSPSGNVENVRLQGLRVVDAGNRLIKVDSTPGSPDTYADGGSLACSALELTAAGRQQIQSTSTECDMGGLTVSHARDWTVEGNIFRGLYCESGGVAQHAIHFWGGSRDTLVERNLVQDCARGVGFGLESALSSRRYVDDPYPGVEPIGHYGGIIRNNVIVAGVAQFDTGIELNQARGSKVLHNSIVHPASAFSSIDYRFANTLAELRNNIVVRFTSRDQGQAELSNNLEAASSELFVDLAGADLHLAAAAEAAIDQGLVLPDAGADIDGFAHDVGAPDIGADERGAP